MFVVVATLPLKQRVVVRFHPGVPFRSNMTASCAPESVGHRELNVEIHSYYVIVCSGGEIGNHARLRILRFEFESRLEHQFMGQKEMYLVQKDINSFTNLVPPI